MPVPVSSWEETSKPAYIGGDSLQLPPLAQTPTPDIWTGQGERPEVSGVNQLQSYNSNK